MSTHEDRIENVRKQAERAFPGTSEEFAAQWPAIKAEWQRQQTLQALGNTSGDPIKDHVQRMHEERTNRPNPLLGS